VVYDLRKRQIKGDGAKCNFPPLDLGGKLGESSPGSALLTRLHPVSRYCGVSRLGCTLVPVIAESRLGCASPPGSCGSSVCWLAGSCA
jgi:hypothetical protein